MNETPCDKAAAGFIEQMGLAFQADGKPRIAGRVFGFFVVRGGTWSFSDLAAELRVSRGSISTNARLLEALGILEKTARPGDRQDYYQLIDDPYGRLLRGHMERLQKSLDIVAATLDELPAGADCEARLVEMQQFYDLIINSIRDTLLSWSERRRDRMTATERAAGA